MLIPVFGLGFESSNVSEWDDVGRSSNTAADSLRNFANARNSLGEAVI
jgi:hypothetical protein